MMKRFLSMMLALMMVVGMLPISTLTANAAGGFIEIGSVYLYAGEYLEQDSYTPTTTKPVDNYAYFDGTTLELHNYTNDAWIEARFDFVIRLFGYNKVERVLARDTEPFTGYDLTICGNGTLCLYTSGDYNLIVAKSLCVQSGNLDMISPDSTLYWNMEEVTYPSHAIALCSQYEGGTWEPFDFVKVRDNGYKRVMIISGAYFGLQSPAMPEGKTEHDLGTVVASNYPISFQGAWTINFTSAGYTQYETLTVLNSKSQTVYDKSQACNGEGLTYDLKDLPADRYVINETLTVLDANDKLVFSETHTFTIDWAPINFSSLTPTPTSDELSAGFTDLGTANLGNAATNITFAGYPEKLSDSAIEAGATVSRGIRVYRNDSEFYSRTYQDNELFGWNLKENITDGGEYRIEVYITLTYGDTYAEKMHTYQIYVIGSTIDYIEAIDLETPVIGQEPDYTVTCDIPGVYVHDVVWNYYDEKWEWLVMDDGAVFETGQRYEVTIEFRTEDGFSFTETSDGMTAYINGMEATVVRNPYATNKAYVELEFTPLEMGDINADGKFNVADVVALQKWIVCAKDAEKSIVEWKAGNFADDDRLDAFDLSLMKRALLNS